MGKFISGWPTLKAGETPTDPRTIKDIGSGWKREGERKKARKALWPRRDLFDRPGTPESKEIDKRRMGERDD